ncbi:hypothetical protein BSL78_05338 [Apostichopus japonicus]|uniref:Uncharacterized protein n=1 Tax=Stichopus japonicus TaxID=307972 RepID=A0A2G8LC49_STIJA|nr:hypothetical protein BSL78_05338 [Apostichopus japonicus]
MKENSRKQSKKTVKRGSDPDYSSNMGMVEDISDSDDSDGGPDKASVGRIASGFESDRGRHVWIGKTNQRKLFAKNNKGYGRSWQKHTWQDEDEDGPSPSEATGHIAEDETATKKDVKPDSYWEDQISDTEYDVDELVSAASVAGKMIGGARASRIMTNLEKSYNDEGEEDGGGGDKEKEEDGQAGRRKTKTRSKRGKSGKQEIPVNDGKRGTGRSKQRTVKGRAARGDVEESDEECVGQKKVQKRKQQRENDEEDYRIEDEREPERKEEDVHIQAKRRAKRNPYLRKQPPSKVEPTLGKRKKIHNVEGEVDQKRQVVEDVEEQNKGKAKRQSGKQSNKNVYDEDEDYQIEDEREPERDEEDLRIEANRRAKRNPYLKKQPSSKVEPALEKRKKIHNVGGEVYQKRQDVEDVDEQNKGKAKRQSVKQSNKNVDDEDEDYRIEDEREPERDEEDLRIQANRRAKRNPYLRKQPQRVIKPTVESRFNDDVDINKPKEKIPTQNVKEGKLSQGKRKSGSSRDTVHANKESVLHPRVVSPGKGKRGRGRGKGKQLLNRKTRFKSSTYGPALSESSDED